MSVPWYFRWLINRDNPRYFLGALVHDELLRRGYDRVTAAAGFNWGLKESNVPRLLRLALTFAVIVRKFK